MLAEKCLQNVFASSGMLNGSIRLPQKQNQSLRSSSYFGSNPSGVLPFSVLFQNNQLINRTFIDLTGYLPPTLYFSRNVFERLEKLLDFSSWFFLAAIGPIVLEKAISQKVTQSFRSDPKLKKYFTEPPTYQKETGFFRRLHQKISHLGKSSPLRIRWEWLQRQAKTIQDTEMNQQRVKDLGLKSVKAMQDLVRDPHGRKRLIRAKMSVVVLDLLLMGAANLIGQWGKNVLTEKLTHKTSFSGTFNYTTRSYQEEQNKRYQKEKQTRLYQSLAVAGGITAAMGAFVAGGLAVKGTNKLAALWRNSVSSLFNYSNGIFMSKWMVLLGGFTNWMLQGVLASRDKHEMREHVIKTGVIAATYTIGDDLLSGLGALWLQGRDSVKKLGVQVVQRGVTGLPDSVKLQTLLAELKAKGVNETHTVYKLAKGNFWFGLIGASLMTGGAVPLLNNWYTKKKVLAEQAKMMKRYLPLFQRPKNKPLKGLSLLRGAT